MLTASMQFYFQLTKSYPDIKVQHRIEHFGFGREEHIKKAVSLDVSISFFVQHLYFYGSSYSGNILGPDRTSCWAPISLAVKYDALWTLHQDHPAFPGPPSPFENLMTAVTRTERHKPDVIYGQEYCISIMEALKGYTINAAKQIGRGVDLGSISVGKQADLIIVDADPVKVADEDPFKIGDIKVLSTYVRGFRVYHRN